MKKYLWLIPAAAFQYTFCTWLSYCFLSMHFTGSIISTALGYLCVFCFFAAIICNIIFMIAVRKEEPRRIVIADFEADTYSHVYFDFCDRLYDGNHVVYDISFYFIFDSG